MEEPPKSKKSYCLEYLNKALSIKKVLAPFFLFFKSVAEINFTISDLCFKKKPEATNLHSLS